NGTFGTAVPYAVGSSPRALAVSDINSDGNLDLITANVGDNSVSVLLGDGFGSFQPALSYPAGMGTIAAAVGGFTADGSLDIVTANYWDGTVSVLLGPGSASFQTSTPGNGIDTRNIPFLQDFTGDGIADSLILDRSGDLLLRLGQNSSTN